VVKSVAIVTGASQGIGQAAAFVSPAISRSRSWSRATVANLEPTAEEVKAAGAQALTIDLDLAPAAKP